MFEAMVAPLALSDTAAFFACGRQPSRCARPRSCHASGMNKSRQTDLDLPASGKVPAERRPTKTRRAKTSRRRLLLLSYQRWLEVTQDVVRAAETGHLRT